MVKKYTKILLFLALLFTGVSGQAVEIKDINTVTVSVVDRESQTLREGFSEAFQAVLIKMSGNTSVMTLPLMQEALAKVHNYIKSYHYEESNVPLKPGLQLRVVFDVKSLHHLLKKANQAVWGSDRPLTLVWLSIPDHSERHILGHTVTHPARFALKEIAVARGIPILFPMMDLEDQNNAVLHMEATLPTAEQLKTVFQRYGVDSVLAGAITMARPERVEAEWRLFLHGKSYEWQTGASDIVQVVKNGLDRAADMMAIQFATIESRGMHSNVLLRVNGVYDLADYVHVLAKLKALAPVAEVSVSEMTPDAILLQITTVGGVSELVDALKTVSHFVSESAQADISSHKPGLFYRWTHESMDKRGPF